MKILYSPNLIAELANSDLFLDTNTFIGAISFPELFEEFFKQLKNSGCAYITIPSVLFEFTRGVESIEAFNKRAEFITSLSSIYLLKDI